MRPRPAPAAQVPAEGGQPCEARRAGARLCRFAEPNFLHKKADCEAVGTVKIFEDF